MAVFPEYAIPWDVLRDVATEAGEAVVAGSHAVERGNSSRKVYADLGWGANSPAPGSAVVPVLHHNRLVALQPKLTASMWESSEFGNLRVGTGWAPVSSVGGLLRFGVLLGSDFLRVGDEPVLGALVNRALPDCRFLAVPSFQFPDAGEDFLARVREEVGRYQRPIFYAGSPAAGGTAILVGHTDSVRLQEFPRQAGYLAAGEEGVIVADVDLGSVPGQEGISNNPDTATARVRPVALASLVYRGYEALEDYARFLDELAPLLGDESAVMTDRLFERLEEDSARYRNAGAFRGPIQMQPGEMSARERRLRRLEKTLPSLNTADEVLPYLAEVILPADVLPLPLLRSALARGAAQVLESWLLEEGGSALGEVYRRLRSAGRASELPDPPLTDPAKRAIANVVQRLQVPREAVGVTGNVELVAEVPEPIDPSLLREDRTDEFAVHFGLEPDVPERTLRELFPLPRSGGVSEIVPAASQTLQLLMQADGAEQFLFAGVVRVSGDAPSTHALYTLGRFGPTWECWRERLTDDDRELLTDLDEHLLAWMPMQKKKPNK